MFDVLIGALALTFTVVALLVRRFQIATSNTADWASRRRDAWARGDMRAALRQIKRRRGRRGSRRAEIAWWLELDSDPDVFCPCPKCVLPLQGSN